MRKMIFILILIPLLGASEPEVNARAALLMDAKTGRVLWEKNGSEPMAMASTTKIMTAVLALESGRANETVTVSQAATAAPKVKMNLSPSEEIRLGDLMLALMLESSNDAAVAIAEHLAGTTEAFCIQMTEKAREIGAQNTVFQTPNGLDAGDHHSTAYDLALITRYALSVPGFIELTNTPAAHFASNKRSYSMNNKNRLLSEYPGANGVKTGFTNKAGHCFVGAAKQNDMQLISVVLASGWGAEGRARKWSDTKAVLNFGFGSFGYETVIQAEEPAGTLEVTRSRSTELEYIYNESLTIPLSEGETVKVKIEAPPSLQAPIEKGERIGRAIIYVNNEPYATIGLQTSESASRHDLKTSLEKVLNGWLTTP